MADQYTSNDLFQYDSDQITLSWIGFELSDAFPDQPGVVNISFDNPQFDLLPNGLGGWVYKSFANSSGVCEVVLHGAHPVSQRLYLTIIGGKLTRTIINGPMYLKDEWNGMKILMDGAIPIQYPNQGRGSQINPLIWTFKFGAVKVVPDLKRANQVA